MNKNIYTIGFLAAITMFFVGCAKEVDTPKEVKTHTITVTVQAEDTKTAIVEGETAASYVWSTGDDDYFHIKENGVAATEISMALSHDNAIATFTATFPDSDATEYTYSAYFAKDVSNSGNLKIQTLQSPALDSFDPSADLLVAQDITETSRPSSLKFMLRRVISMNKMTLKELDPGETISSVEISSDKPLGGYFVFAGTDKDGNPSEEHYSVEGKKITLNYGSDAIVPSTGVFPVYFACGPQDANQITVRVVTDRNLYVRNNFSSTVDFRVGVVKRFGVKLGDYGTPLSGGTVYTLVEDDSDLYDGATYLLVGCSNKTSTLYALGEQRQNNRAGVVVSDNNGVITVDNTIAVYPIVIDATTGGYTLKDVDSDMYLYSSFTSKNYLSSQSEVNNYAIWTIDIVNKVATINNVGNTSRGKLCFNPNWQNNNGDTNPIFASYETVPTSNGGTQALALYIDRSTAIQSLTTPDILAEASGNSIVVMWDDVQNADKYYVTCTGQEPQTINTGVEEAIFSELDDGNYTITVTAVSNNHSVYRDSAPASATVKIGKDFTTIAKLNELASATPATLSGNLTNAVVSFVPDADHAFIKDATGTVQLFASGHGLSQGQTFSGDLNVTLVLYNSCSELTSCDAEFTGSQSTVLPADMTLAALVGNLATYQNAYVKVEDLEVTNVNGQNLTVSDGNNSYIVYTKYGSSNCVIGDILTVVGTVSHHSNNDQITVWASEDLTLTYHPVASLLTIAQVIDASANTSVATSGVVAQVNQKGFILTDGNDNIFVYQNAVPTVSVGQAVTVEGTRSAYNNVAQIAAPTITPGATGQTIARTTLTTVTSSNATGYTTSTYVSLTGVLSISGNYFNVSISGSTTQGSLYQLSGSESFTAGEISTLSGKAIIVTGYVTGSTNSYLNIAPVNIELDLTPSLVVSPATTSESPANWPSNNSTAMEFTVTAVNGTWSISNNGVSSWANVDTSNNKITVTPKTAQSSTANSGSIVITLTPTDNNYSALTETIYLSQAKYEAGKKWTLVSSLNGITNGTYSIAALSSNNYYTVPNTTISGQTFNCTQASYSSTEGLTPPPGAGEFVLTAVSGVTNAFYIYNTNLQKYLVATGSKTFGYVDSSSSNYGYWTFSTVSSGGFSGQFSIKHSSKTHYMRAYSNSVRCYDGPSNNGVYLFIYN